MCINPPSPFQSTIQIRGSICTGAAAVESANTEGHTVSADGYSPVISTPRHSSCYFNPGGVRSCVRGDPCVCVCVRFKWIEGSLSAAEEETSGLAASQGVGGAIGGNPASGDRVPRRSLRRCSRHAGDVGQWGAWILEGVAIRCNNMVLTRRRHDWSRGGVNQSPWKSYK